MKAKKMNCSGQGMLHEQKHNLEWGADLTPERYNLPILAQEQHIKARSRQGLGAQESWGLMVMGRRKMTYPQLGEK